MAFKDTGLQSRNKPCVDSSAWLLHQELRMQMSGENLYECRVLRVRLAWSWRSFTLMRWTFLRPAMWSSCPAASCPANNLTSWTTRTSILCCILPLVASAEMQCQRKLASTTSPNGTCVEYITQVQYAQGFHRGATCLRILCEKTAPLPQ